MNGVPRVWVAFAKAARTVVSPWLPVTSLVRLARVARCGSGDQSFVARGKPLVLRSGYPGRNTSALYSAQLLPIGGR